MSPEFEAEVVDEFGRRGAGRLFGLLPLGRGQGVGPAVGSKGSGGGQEKQAVGGDGGCRDFLRG